MATAGSPIAMALVTAMGILIQILFSDLFIGHMCIIQVRDWTGAGGGGHAVAPDLGGCCMTSKS